MLEMIILPFGNFGEVYKFGRGLIWPIFSRNLSETKNVGFVKSRVKELVCGNRKSMSSLTFDRLTPVFICFVALFPNVKMFLLDFLGNIKLFRACLAFGLLTSFSACRLFRTPLRRFLQYGVRFLDWISLFKFRVRMFLCKPHLWRMGSSFFFNETSKEPQNMDLRPFFFVCPAHPG